MRRIVLSITVCFFLLHSLAVTGWMKSCAELVSSVGVTGALEQIPFPVAKPSLYSAITHTPCHQSNSAFSDKTLLESQQVSHAILSTQVNHDQVASNQTSNYQSDHHKHCNGVCFCLQANFTPIALLTSQISVPIFFKTIKLNNQPLAFSSILQLPLYRPPISPA